MASRKTMETVSLTDDLWTLSYPASMDPLCAIYVISEKVLVPHTHLHHDYYHGLFASMATKMNAAFPNPVLTGLASNSSRDFSTSLRSARTAKMRHRGRDLASVQCFVHTSTPRVDPPPIEPDPDAYTIEKCVNAWSLITSIVVGLNKQWRSVQLHEEQDAADRFG